MIALVLAAAQWEEWMRIDPPAATSSRLGGGLSATVAVGEIGGAPILAAFRGNALDAWNLETRERLWSLVPDRCWIGAADGGGLLHSVEPGSPAEAAGLVVGDRVLSVNGRARRGMFFPGGIADLAPGDELALEVENVGGVRAVLLRVGREPSGAGDFTRTRLDFVGRQVLFECESFTYLIDAVTGDARLKVQGRSPALDEERVAILTRRPFEVEETLAAYRRVHGELIWSAQQPRSDDAQAVWFARGILTLGSYEDRCELVLRAGEVAWARGHAGYTHGTLRAVAPDRALAAGAAVDCPSHRQGGRCGRFLLVDAAGRSIWEAPACRAESHEVIAYCGQGGPAPRYGEFRHEPLAACIPWEGRLLWFDTDREVVAVIRGDDGAVMREIPVKQADQFAARGSPWPYLPIRRREPAEWLVFDAGTGQLLGSAPSQGPSDVLAWTGPAEFWVGTYQGIAGYRIDRSEVRAVWSRPLSHCGLAQPGDPIAVNRFPPGEPPRMDLFDPRTGEPRGSIPDLWDGGAHPVGSFLVVGSMGSDTLQVFRSLERPPPRR